MLVVQYLFWSWCDYPVEIMKMEFYERKKWSDARRKGKNAEQQDFVCHICVAAEKDEVKIHCLEY